MINKMQKTFLQHFKHFKSHQTYLHFKNNILCDTQKSKMLFFYTNTSRGIIEILAKNFRITGVSTSLRNIILKEIWQERNVIIVKTKQK